MSVNRRVTSSSSSHTGANLPSPRTNPFGAMPARADGGPQTQSQLNQAQVLFQSSSLALLRVKTNQPQDKKVNKSIDDPTYIAGASKVLHFMYCMWREQVMCDLLIRVEGGDIYAHKVALAAYSSPLADKFRKMPIGEIATIDLTDIPPAIVLAILEFTYTTDIAIRDNNVGHLLFCATEIGFEIVIKLCLEHLSKYNPDNAMLYFTITEQQGLDELSQKIYNYICSHFMQIVQSTQFVHMPLEKLVHLLSVNNLTINSELDVFLAIVRWVDHSRRDRLPMAAMLLQCVRFQLLSSEILITRVETVEWIFASRECHNIVCAAYKYHALDFSGSGLVTNFAGQSDRQPGSGQVPSPRNGDPAFLPTYPPNQSQASPRNLPSPYPDPQGMINPMAPSEGNWYRTSLKVTPRANWGTSDRQELVAVAVGGIDIQSVDPDVPGRFLHKLDPVANRWNILTTMGSYTHHHAVAETGTRIFVTGGCHYDNNHPDRLGVATNRVNVFEMESHQWIPVAHMKEARAYHTASAWRNYVFVAGGETRTGRKLDSLERFDPMTNTWSYVARLQGGGKVGLASAVYQDHLFIVGGFNKTRPGLPVVDDVECFDLLNERWVARRPLPTPCCHAGLIVADGRLFLVGGRTRSGDIDNPLITSLSAILEYVPFSDSWNHIGDLCIDRHDFGYTAVGSKVFVVGGMTSPSPVCLSSVECFDVNTRQFDESVENLPFSAAGIGCCAVQLH